jgi:hypothetical protein
LRRGPRSPSFDLLLAYLPVELPEVLPLPIEPLELPVLGVLGDAGEVLVEPLVLPLEPEELLLPMPEELLLPPLELDLLKCASHSEREIDPSLLVSTDEKLGVLRLLPELELLGDWVLDDPPAAPLADEPLALPPADDGDEDELPLVADGEDDEPLDFLASSAAVAARDRAKSAAAVVTVTVLSIG